MSNNDDAQPKPTIPNVRRPPDPHPTETTETTQPLSPFDPHPKPSPPANPTTRSDPRHVRQAVPIRKK